MWWLLKEPLFCIKQTICLGAFLLGLLGQKDGLDVGKNTALSNSDTTKKFVQFLVVSDSQLQVTWDNPGLLVVSGSVTSQLKDFSAQVLEDSSQVDWSTGTNSLSVVTLAKMTMDTTNRELKSCTG
jgi:hypothetical protein